MFIKRPFFMLLSIDGPISDRFRRANKFVLYILYILLHHALLRLSDRAGVSLDAFIIANDADVYGRRSDPRRPNDKPENGQVEYPSPLHSLQKHVTLHMVNNFDSVAALRSYLDDINLLDADRQRPSWDSYFMVGFA
jgi:dCMP deaminase